MPSRLRVVVVDNRCHKGNDAVALLRRAGQKLGCWRKDASLMVNIQSVTGHPDHARVLKARTRVFIYRERRSLRLQRSKYLKRMLEYYPLYGQRRPQPLRQRQRNRQRGGVLQAAVRAAVIEPIRFAAAVPAAPAPQMPGLLDNAPGALEEVQVFEDVWAAAQRIRER